MAGTTGGIVEYALPGTNLTFTAGAAITGGMLVKISANRTVIKTAAATDIAVGVALFTAASGDTNLTVSTGGVWPLVADGAITYGQLLQPSGAVAGAVKTLVATDATNVGTLGTASDNTRAIAAQALESIADTATGRCHLRLA